MASYENTMKTRTAIHVTYKDIKVPFVINKTEKYYTLVPQTILENKMQFNEFDQIIEIDMSNDEFKITRN